jgi:hypothetical protein
MRPNILGLVDCEVLVGVGRGVAEVSEVVGISSECLLPHVVIGSADACKIHT